MSATGGACAWCGAPVEAPADARVFCCSGCEAAAALVEAAGLDRYFAEREALPARPAVQASGWDRVPVEATGEHERRVRLAIDGLRCASCVWVTERVLAATPGVSEATVSYATGRAELRWDPRQTSLEQLASRVSALGYRPRLLSEPPRADRDLLTRLGVAAFAAANVMMLSVPLYLGWWQGMDERFAALFRLLSLALAAPVALWAAVPFYRGALAGLKSGVPHVDLPVSLGVVALSLHGLVSTLRGQEAYLDSMTMLVALLLAGRVVDQGHRRRTVAAAAALAASAPRAASRLDAAGQREQVSPEDLAVGDRVAVVAGEELPADGQVERGQGSVRLALLTGESEPVPVGPGDRVVAGAVLIDGSITVIVEALARDSLLERMAESLRQAQERPVSPTAADRLAPLFTVLTLAVASATLIGHGLLSGWEPALKAAVAVLVVACPCALALSGPLSDAAGLGAAARRGLLLRSGDALRRLAEVDLVALDKTGTLTQGAPEVVEADPAVLRIAAGVARHSGHPKSRAIVAAAEARGLAMPLGALLAEEPGVGVTAEVDGQAYTLRSAGSDAVGLWRVGAEVPVGLIRLSDQPRPDAARAVAGLRALGLEVVLLTGDHAEVAARVSAATGVPVGQAGARPEDKVAYLRARQAERRRVLFVGDGLNDGPALEAADAAISMGGGAASSVLIADGVVATEALGPLVAGIGAARRAARASRAALCWSVGYNALAVAAAAAGLVNPLVAAVLMPVSSGVVVARAASIGRGARERDPALAAGRAGAQRAVPGALPAGCAPGAV